MFLKTRFEKEKAPRAWDAGASSGIAAALGLDNRPRNIARPSRAVKRPRTLRLPRSLLFIYGDAEGRR
jgi:hypothetical protein